MHRTSVHGINVTKPTGIIFKLLWNIFHFSLKETSCNIYRIFSYCSFIPYNCTLEERKKRLISRLSLEETNLIQLFLPIFRFSSSFANSPQIDPTFENLLQISSQSINDTRNEREKKVFSRKNFNLAPG